MSSTSFALPNCTMGRGFSAIPPLPLRRSLRVSAAGNSTSERGNQTVQQYSPSASSFYEVLGIRTSATLSEIKCAYRNLARVTHPDIASSRGGDGSEFMRVHAAYATLSDPEKRAAYDNSLFRLRMSAVSLDGGYSAAANPRRRTWETDQCW